MERVENINCGCVSCLLCREIESKKVVKKKIYYEKKSFCKHYNKWVKEKLGRDNCEYYVWGR